MAAELQSLLDKIQSEGVDKANQKARTIIENAEKTAADKISAAEKKCTDLRDKAQADAAVLHERAEQAVRQAARDVVIEVGQSIQQTLERVLLKDVDSKLSGDFLCSFLDTLVKAFAKDPNAAGGMEVLVAPDQAEKLAAYARAKLASTVSQGLKISPDRHVTAGMRIMLADGRIEHDFTDEAIMTAMSRLMSPALTQMIFGKA